MNALGCYLRIRAKERGLSMAELARRTGISRQTLHTISQSEQRLPEIETVVRIAVELAVHPLQLFHLVFEGYRLPARMQRLHRERGDRSIFVTDVTIPDGTVVAPESRFTKVWEVQNVGTVPWEGRTLKCMDDDILVSRRTAQGPDVPVFVTDKLKPASASIEVPFTPPGEIVRLAVDFVAPALPGTCLSYWKSFHADGSLCFPSSVGLVCKVRVLSMTAALVR